MSTISPAVAIDRLRAAFGRPAEHDTTHRTLHAKGAYYSGTFTATPHATELCTAGHLQGEEVPILVRWSNGGGNHRAPDKAPEVRRPTCWGRRRRAFPSGSRTSSSR